jgi:hypothetical protein
LELAVADATPGEGSAGVGWVLLDDFVERGDREFEVFEGLCGVARLLNKGLARDEVSVNCEFGGALVSLARATE